MAHTLNLTLPLKQDAQTKQVLAVLPQLFGEKLQPLIDAALRKSTLVHFARIVVIKDQYVQVLTEYDGDRRTYTDFFAKELHDVFAQIFALVEGGSATLVDNPDKFYEFSRAHNITPLGRPVAGNDVEDGYVFSAYGSRSVKEILAAVNKA